METLVGFGQCSSEEIVWERKRSFELEGLVFTLRNDLHAKHLEGNCSTQEAKIHLLQCGRWLHIKGQIIDLCSMMYQII